MNAKIIRSLIRALLFPVVFILALFWSAGTLRWGMGWLFTLVYLLGTIINVGLLYVFSPGLITERGNNPEDYPLWDKLLGLGMALIGPLLLFVVCGLDYRYGWATAFPGWLVVISLMAMVAGQVITNWAMLANRFFSGAVYIQKERGHRVISSGPYAWVRHPGYLGVVLFNLAVPFLLSSWWGLLVAVLVVTVTVVRTYLEDATLQRELPGYAVYVQEVRFRLIPWVW